MVDAKERAPDQGPGNIGSAVNWFHGPKPFLFPSCTSVPLISTMGREYSINLFTLIIYVCPWAHPGARCWGYRDESLCL